MLQLVSFSNVCVLTAAVRLPLIIDLHCVHAPGTSDNDRYIESHFFSKLEYLRFLTAIHFPITRLSLFLQFLAKVEREYVYQVFAFTKYLHKKMYHFASSINQFNKMWSYEFQTQAYMYLHFLTCYPMCVILCHMYHNIVCDHS